MRTTRYGVLGQRQGAPLNRRPRRGYVKLVFETAEGEQVRLLRLLLCLAQPVCLSIVGQSAAACGTGSGASGAACAKPP